jgi:hypothetical protein
MMRLDLSFMTFSARSVMNVNRKRDQAKVKLKTLRMMAASGVVRPAHVEIRYLPRPRVTTPPLPKKERPAKPTVATSSPPKSPSLLTMAFTLPVTEFIRHLRHRRSMIRPIPKLTS